jgi:inhibitor of KinA sporulation pathway (predicted exonuclease)
MGKPRLEAAKLMLRIVVTRPRGSAEPVPVAEEVTLVEAVQSEVMSADRITSTIRPVRKPSLAERVRDTALAIKCTSQLGHGFRVSAEGQMP